MISNIRLYQTISEIINFIKGRINLGIKKGARPSVIRACHHFCMSFCNKISGEKKVSKELLILLFSFSCASHTVKLYYLEYILWRYWPQAGPTFIGLYPGNSEKQPLRNRNPYASWKWSQKAQTNTNTTTATEKLESNMQH